MGQPRRSGRRSPPNTKYGTMVSSSSSSSARRSSPPAVRSKKTRSEPNLVVPEENKENNSGNSPLLQPSPPPASRENHGRVTSPLQSKRGDSKFSQESSSSSSARKVRRWQHNMCETDPQGTPQWFSPPPSSARKKKSEGSAADGDDCTGGNHHMMQTPVAEGDVVERDTRGRPSSSSSRQPMSGWSDSRGRRTDGGRSRRGEEAEDERNSTSPHPQRHHRASPRYSEAAMEKGSRSSNLRLTLPPSNMEGGPSDPHQRTSQRDVDPRRGGRGAGGHQHHRRSSIDKADGTAAGLDIPSSFGSIAAELDLAAKEHDRSEHEMAGGCLNLDPFPEEADAAAAATVADSSSGANGKHDGENSQPPRESTGEPSTRRSSPSAQHQQRQPYPSPNKLQNGPNPMQPFNYPQPPNQDNDTGTPSGRAYQGSSPNTHHHASPYMQRSPPHGHPMTGQSGGGHPGPHPYYHGHPHQASPPPNYYSNGGQHQPGHPQYGYPPPPHHQYSQPYPSSYNQGPWSPPPNHPSGSSSGQQQQMQQRNGRDRKLDDARRTDVPDSKRSSLPSAPSPMYKKRRIATSTGNDGMGSWDSPEKGVGTTAATSRTPENIRKSSRSRSDNRDIMNAAPSSPYRSPMANLARESDGRLSSSNNKYKRSPLFSAETPTFFGVHTPGGHMDDSKIDEFSPVGSSFPPELGLPGDQVAEPHPFSMSVDEGDEQFVSKVGISRTGSMDSTGRGGGFIRDSRGRNNSRSPLSRNRRGNDDVDSPFSSDFMGELSPLPNSRFFQASPVRPYQPDNYVNPRYNHPSTMDGTSERHRSVPSIPPLKRNNGAHMLKASPVSSVSGSLKHKQRHFDDGSCSSPKPFRIQLGNVGMKHSEARRSIDGINSALRNGPVVQSSRHGSSLGHWYPSGGGHSNDSGGNHNSTIMRNDLSTPIKVPNSASRNVATPSQSGIQSYPVSSSMSHGGHPHSVPRYNNVPGHLSTPSQSPQAPGKENEPPKPTRRNPCNCKRSKCLKLYCECFAAERYCDGCNCQDCSNTTAYESIRSKAIKDTKAKNPNAFKPRIATKSGSSTISCNSPSTGHNMGCKCKKSACLKKYCECFEAGVMCGNKCKCVGCLNYVGSQALIDRRRKIKDLRGAELAMRTADEAWKGGHLEQQNRRGPGNPAIPPHSVTMPSPAARQPHRPMGHPVVVPPMMHPSPGMHNWASPSAPPSMMMGHPPMGYSPMVPQPGTPAYSSAKPPSYSGGRHTGNSRYSRSAQKSNSKSFHSSLSTPRTPAVRLGFDPHSSKKKRKMGLGKEEPAFNFFGPRFPQQPKTTALTIFSFLSNDDLYNASLVSKAWTGLSLDEELWQF